MQRSYHYYCNNTVWLSQNPTAHLDLPDITRVWHHCSNAYAYEDGRNTAFQTHKKRDLALIRDDGFFLSVSFVYWPPYNDVNLISSSNHYQSQACYYMIQSIYNKTEATAIPTGTFRGQRKQQRTEVANYSHNIFSGCSCTLWLSCYWFSHKCWIPILAD